MLHDPIVRADIRANYKRIQRRIKLLTALLTLLVISFEITLAATHSSPVVMLIVFIAWLVLTLKAIYELFFNWTAKKINRA